MERSERAIYWEEQGKQNKAVPGDKKVSTLLAEE